MNLTAEELLTSLKYCMGELGGSKCTGCPNSIAGSENASGMCICRFHLQKEMIGFLEAYIQEKSK